MVGMFHTRIPRRVEVDWSRRRGERIPITQAATYAFGEPGYAERAGQPVEGMICWDPADGWVLDVPPKQLEEALARPEIEPSPRGRGD
jgi:hypothetical protein